MHRALLAILLSLNFLSPLMNAADPQGQFADVNGLRMYYELHGQGRPLVLIHGGGSTIESTFGRILPMLAKSRRVIAVELQAHGHTLDIDRPLSFEHDADDVAALLRQLHVEKADILGFSNGGTTALQIAIRHPQQAGKLVLASATFRRDAMPPAFWEGFKNASLATMPKPLQDAYLKANPDPKGLQRMFDRDVARMTGFQDMNEEPSARFRRPPWSSTAIPTSSRPSTRWPWLASSRTGSSPSSPAAMATTSAKSAPQIHRVRCRRLSPR